MPAVARSWGAQSSSPSLWEAITAALQGLQLWEAESGARAWNQTQVFLMWDTGVLASVLSTRLSACCIPELLEIPYPYLYSYFFFFYDSVTAKNSTERENQTES